MNCIIIEKPNAQSRIKEYVNTIPYFNLVSCCSSVFDAYEILQNQTIDIIFVDTELQRVSGIDFIKSLDHHPFFVLISQDPELAVDAYSLNALDFLLKPVSFDRFLKTANKVYEQFRLYQQKVEPKNETEEAVNGNSSNNKTVLVKTDYKTILIRVNEILYIEGLKDYIKIYISNKDKPVITLNSLKRLQQNLPSEKFSRIHKSYIVGLDHINAINKTQVMIHNKHIPIGESYRMGFSKKLDELRI